jgi:hypothetical protein
MPATRRLPLNNPGLRPLLIRHGIYPDRFTYRDGFVQPKPGNWDQLLQVLEGSRPESISEEAFAAFCQQRNRIVINKPSDKSIMRHLFPILQGSCRDPSEKDKEFKNLTPLPGISDEVVPACPGVYYGEDQRLIRPRIHTNLHGFIVP